MNDLPGAKPERPFFVRFALWGMKSRSVAMLCMAFSVVAALASVVLKFWLGLLFLLAAGGYWYSIKWVDRNGGWDGRGPIGPSGA